MKFYILNTTYSTDLQLDKVLKFCDTIIEGALQSRIRILPTHHFYFSRPFDSQV